MFKLHNFCVYVEYEGGRKENVASADALDAKQAYYFWKMWNKWNVKENEYKESYKLRYVTLEDNEKVYEKYEFNDLGDIMVRDYKNKLLGVMPIKE